MITRAGGPEVLQVQDRPDPEPGPGEALVRVRAAGINFADTMARAGIYPDAPKLPCVVGYEVAGDVERVAEGVDGIAPGDRVLGGTRFGGYAELVATPAHALVPLPDGWSFEEGAAFPVNYATAYAGLGRYGAVHPGERVLIHAAAGGVGIAATQIARLLGAEIYGTASAAKHDAIRGLGVEHAIDYRSEDFVAATRRIAGVKRPLDLVMDAIGGFNLWRSYSLLRPGGRLVAYGVSTAMKDGRRNLAGMLRMALGTPISSALPLMSSSKALIGLNLLRLWDAKGSLDELIDPLRAWVDQGELRPVIAEAFPLERGGDAHRYLGERRNVGKVVLTLD